MDSPAIPVTTCKARDLRPGDTFVDVFGNERAVKRLAIHSPYLLSVTTINRAGAPCGETLDPNEWVRVRVAPDWFTPQVFD